MERAIPRPLLFGEVLFDRFPDGTDVLGGAPFNVAWHLQGLGLAPLFISRVGRDSLGDRILEHMQAWGMDCSGIQRDSTHPTGTVQVNLREGQPTFDILPEQAYDFIELSTVEELLVATEIALLYHGSLAWRSATSKQTLEWLRTHTAWPVFLDINLRSPWWSLTGIDRILHGVRWLKLNQDELLCITPMPADASLQSRCRILHQHYEIRTIIVTRGAHGVMVSHNESISDTTAPPVADVVDTVGAGDAFSAVTLFGLIRQWSHTKTAHAAVDFAARICRIRGATVQDRHFYQEFLRQWED